LCPILGLIPEFFCL